MAMAPDVALASIGGASDRASGLTDERQWQRHGIETACSSLSGALVVAASHIAVDKLDRLPPLLPTTFHQRSQLRAQIAVASL